MCGIAGIYLKNPNDRFLRSKELDDIVDWMALGIEHRGTHATGIATQNWDGNTFLEKADMPASKFIFWRRDVDPEARTILLHTRLYTKGKPDNLLNNHPVQYDNIMMTHNGHIANDDELFAEEKLNRLAEVDSEAISALLHKYSLIEPKKALEKLLGGFAIAAIDANEPGKLLLAKGNTSPLVFVETNGMWLWASEQKVLEDTIENALGMDAKTFTYETVKYGQYVLIDGENHRKADFTVATKQYVYTPPKNNGYANPNQYNGDVYHGGGWKSGSGSRDNYRDNYMDQCDECFSYFYRYQLNRFEMSYFCDRCEARLFDIDKEGMRSKKANPKKLSRKERKRLRKEARSKFLEETKKREKAAEEEKQKKQNTPRLVDVTELDISEILDEEHKLVCGMVAEFYGTKSEFVDMVLFSEAAEEEIADGDSALVSMYLEFEEKYNEFLEDVRGTTDEIMNKITEKHNDSCSVNPVGFGPNITL